jgi:hypothetical protein
MVLNGSRWMPVTAYNSPNGTGSGTPSVRPSR